MAAKARVVFAVGERVLAPLTEHGTVISVTPSNVPDDPIVVVQLDNGDMDCDYSSEITSWKMGAAGGQ